MERWIGGCRRELLDRTLIVNERHLRTVLAAYETHFNTHRPHHALRHAAPLRPLPDPTAPDAKAIRRDPLSGVIHEYTQVACGGRVSGTHRSWRSLPAAYTSWASLPTRPATGQSSRRVTSSWQWTTALTK
ncbi:integrase core domain-containing protein [Streptomyces sp. NBC_01381]|uniref:integrase core domain-containing protein n=1 Tax=Streptomyces sp. NBC_01381 TaxID=2903845 RepID=UPI002B1CFA22|nr:integrase core domain-containing protein [Streptomyces sp. NBC_01381]